MCQSWVPVCLKKLAKHNARKAAWFTKATVHWSNFCIIVDSMDSQIILRMIRESKRTFFPKMTTKKLPFSREFPEQEKYTRVFIPTPSVLFDLYSHSLYTQRAFQWSGRVKTFSRKFKWLIYYLWGLQGFTLLG